MIPFNNNVAKNLRKIAELLKAQHANYFRCQAYLNAAQTIEQSPQNLRALFDEQGIKGLINLPTIGSGIAHLIYEYITTGRMSRLDHLQGAADPIALLQMIPTIGQEMAERIHETLHINTLASLEHSLHTGELANVKGLGKKRHQAIEDWLARNFTERYKKLRADKSRDTNPAPSIELLLNLDTEYRDKAKIGKLPLITPKRFNPNNTAWLPILHKQQEDWHFSLMYSNTERAHKLHRVYDWVIIFFYDSHHQEGHYTVVTEINGTLKGLRVVRGREDECHDYYDRLT